MPSDGLMLERVQRILAGDRGSVRRAGPGRGGVDPRSWEFPDPGFAPLMYKFTVLNYFVIFLNLDPLLELDGYFFLSELTEVPDLASARTLKFIQHDLWHKFRERERFRARGRPWSYAFAGVVFTILSVCAGDLLLGGDLRGPRVGPFGAGGRGSRLLLLLIGRSSSPARWSEAWSALGGARPAGSRRGLARCASDSGSRPQWRVEAATADRRPARFADLTEDVLSDLAGRMPIRSRSPGQPDLPPGRTGPTPSTSCERAPFRSRKSIPTRGSRWSCERLSRATRSASWACSGQHLGGDRPGREAKPSCSRSTRRRSIACSPDAIEAPTFALDLADAPELREMPAFSTPAREDLSKLLAHGRWVIGRPRADRWWWRAKSATRSTRFRSGQVERRSWMERRSVRKRPGSALRRDRAAARRPPDGERRGADPVRAFRFDREGFDLSPSERRSAVGS